MDKLIAEALVTRGKRKGRLLVKCPPLDTRAAAVWQGIISIVNPYKLGFGHLMFMSKANRAVFEEVLVWCEGKDLRWMDDDRMALDMVW